MSIRLRLTLWYAGVLSLVLAAFAVVVYVAVERQLAGQLDYDVQLRAVQTAQTLRVATRSWPGRPVRLLSLPAVAAPPNETLYVQVVGPRGEVLTRSNNLAEPLPIPPASLEIALDGQEAEDLLTVQGERLELYTAPLLLDGSVVGAVQVAAPLRPLEETLAGLRMVLGAVVLGATALAAGLGWVLATIAMRPVDRITRAARAIGSSADLSRRLPEPGRRDELGRLAATFNEMLGRLDRAFATQRQFLADASHELRTPLTSVRTNVETLLRDGARVRAGSTDHVGDEPTEREAALRSIARETDRMGRLVADLLVLARADDRQPLERRRVPLDALLLEVYRQEKPRGGDRLAIGELEQVEVIGDADRLKQLALNLVDNALRYTGNGGGVTLDVVGRDGWAVLRVRDSGPGIPPEHLPKIFERFYRADRTGARHPTGTGLGLAISRWIAEAHGGRIEVESRLGAGSTFSVLLPAAGVGSVELERRAVAAVPSRSGRG